MRPLLHVGRQSRISTSSRPTRFSGAARHDSRLTLELADREYGSGAAELAVEEFAAEEDDGGAAVGAGDAEVAGFEVADEGIHLVE